MGGFLSQIICHCAKVEIISNLFLYFCLLFTIPQFCKNMITKKFRKKALPHLAIIVCFLTIAFIYFSPVLDGKELIAHDTESWHYSAKEAADFNQTGKGPTLWTNSMFGGMPTYQITMPRNYNWLHNGQTVLSRMLPTPVFILFLYLICFYVLLICMGCNKWLAVTGSLFFSFASYNLIIIAAGHITKAVVIAYMGPLIGSIWVAFNRNKIIGALITAAFLSLAIGNNHLQIIYYTLIVLLFFVVVQLIYDIKNKKIKSFLQTLGLLCVSLIVALGMNATLLLTTYEYSKYTMRGESNGLTQKENTSRPGGLDKDYITAWSYGVGESFTFLIPNFKGGASRETLSEDSETANKLVSMRVPKAEIKRFMKDPLPLYWGDQPITSGPVYFGAIVCFLLIIGMYLVDNRLKWWLIPVIILTLMLSWGRNFMPLTDFFIDHVPMYNKFRTVSMMLVATGFGVALLAIFGLKEFLKKDADKDKNKKALYTAAGITGGLCIIFYLIPSLCGNFTGNYDAQFTGVYEFLKSTLPVDRKNMMQSDAVRSLIFIVLSGAVLWFYNERKAGLKIQYVYILLAILVTADMWVVAKRYLNDSNFEAKRQKNAIIKPSPADQFILQDKSSNRVLDITVDIFNDAKPAYFHKAIGGYSAVKLSRYQELIEYHLAADISKLTQGLQNAETQQEIDSILSSTQILNMLNMRYLIYNHNSQPMVNPFANGNAWLVSSYRIAQNADEEMQLLGLIDTRNELVVDKRFADRLTDIQNRDQDASIRLIEYAPNRLVYQFDSQTNQIAIFSEIFYDRGWNAYINGEKVPYFRANYLLRAMSLEKGTYEVEFRFEPKSFSMGNIAANISSGLFILAVILFLIFRNKKRSI